MGYASETQNMLIFNQTYQPKTDYLTQGEKTGFVMTLPDINIINRKKVQPCGYVAEKLVWIVRKVILEIPE